MPVNVYKIIYLIFILVIIFVTARLLHNLGKVWWYSPLIAATAAIGFLSSLFLGDPQSFYRLAANRFVDFLFHTNARAIVGIISLIIIVFLVGWFVWRTWPPSTNYLRIKIYEKYPNKSAIGIKVILHTFTDGLSREAEVDNKGTVKFSDIHIPTSAQLTLQQSHGGGMKAWEPEGFDLKELPYTINYDILAIPDDAWMVVQTLSENIGATVKEVAVAVERDSFLNELGDGSFQKINSPWGIPEAELIINRYAYILGLNPQKRIARWVAYSFSVTEQQWERPNNWRPDPAVPADMQPSFQDFRGSGYDRGSLVSTPDVGFKGQLAVLETFYMSVITPQTANLNRYVWRNLEKATHELAQSIGQIYVHAGPLFLGNSPISTIGKNAIPVPTHFFRIISWLSNEGKFQVVAYIISNDVEKGTDFRDFAVSVSEVEEKSGLNFFPFLAVENSQAIKDSIMQIS